MKYYPGKPAPRLFSYIRKQIIHIFGSLEKCFKQNQVNGRQYALVVKGLGPGHGRG